LTSFIKQAVHVVPFYPVLWCYALMLCSDNTDLFSVEGSYVPHMFLMPDWHNQSFHCMIYSIHVGCSLCL